MSFVAGFFCDKQNLLQLITAINIFDLFNFNYFPAFSPTPTGIALLNLSSTFLSSSIPVPPAPASPSASLSLSTLVALAQQYYQNYHHHFHFHLYPRHQHQHQYFCLLSNYEISIFFSLLSKYMYNDLASYIISILDFTS